MIEYGVKILEHRMHKLSDDEINVLLDLVCYCIGNLDDSFVALFTNKYSSFDSLSKPENYTDVIFDVYEKLIAQLA